MALVLAYSVLIFTAITFIPLRIFSVLREYYFAYFLLLHHRACITSLTLLQSHHHKSLIKLTSLQLHHHTSLIKLMSITSLHFNYNTCSKLTLHYSCIPPHSSDTIHLQIRSGFQIPHLLPTLVSLFHKFVSSSTSNNIWNTSKLLLLSADVETNPEPWPIDLNPVFFFICSNKINRGIQQDTASTSPDANCHARCHQACNDFTWKCPQHGTGIAKITIPPPPVYELPSRSSAAGKPCSVSQNPICCRYADLAYSCANLSYDNVCHLVATCSGFVNPRGTTRACILSTQIWHCHLHSSTSEVYSRVLWDSLFTSNFSIYKKDTCKL